MLTIYDVHRQPELVQCAFLQPQFVEGNLAWGRVIDALRDGVFMLTLSNTIVQLIHVQILDIGGQDAVEQLCHGQGMRSGRDGEYRRCSRPPWPGPTTRPW